MEPNYREFLDALFDYLDEKYVQHEDSYRSDLDARRIRVYDTLGVMAMNLSMAYWRRHKNETDSKMTYTEFFKDVWPMMSKEE